MAFAQYSNPCHPRSGGGLNESDYYPDPWVYMITYLEFERHRIWRGRIVVVGRRMQQTF